MKAGKTFISGTIPKAKGDKLQISRSLQIPVKTAN